MEQCFQSSCAQYPRPPIMRNTTSLASSIQAQYKQVNLCTYSPKCIKENIQGFCSILCAKLIYKLQLICSDRSARLLKVLKHAWFLYMSCGLVLRRNGCHLGHLTPERSPAYCGMREVIINATFSAAAMKKIFQRPWANVKKQFPQTKLNLVNCAMWVVE